MRRHGVPSSRSATRGTCRRGWTPGWMRTSRPVLMRSMTTRSTPPCRVTWTWPRSGPRPASSPPRTPPTPRTSPGGASWQELAASDAACGAAGARGSPGRRGVSPAASGSPAGGFGAGQPLDVAPGGPGLLGFAQSVAGDQERLGGATDDEIIGLICALDRAEASACSLKHAAVAELIRRRPAPGCPLQGQARMPEGWEEFAADEVRGGRWPRPLTRRTRVLDLAHALESEAARHQGSVPGPAWLRWSKVEDHRPGDPDPGPRRGPGGGGDGPGPGGSAEPGRACGPRSSAPLSRSSRTKPASGERTRSGMPGVGALARGQRQRRPGRPRAPARRGPRRRSADHLVGPGQLKAAGLAGAMDELRARAYLDLLLDTDSRSRHPGRPRRGRGRRLAPARTAARPGRIPDTPGSGVIPAGFTGRNHLTVPLATLLELADRPGEIAGLGPVDPWLARDLARASAAQPRDHLVPHRHRRPGSRHRTRMRPTGAHRRRADQRETGPPGGHDPPGLAFTPADTDGPPGGYGSWRVTPPASAASPPC